MWHDLFLLETGKLNNLANCFVGYFENINE